MATYVFTRTRQQLAEKVLRMLGIVGGEDPMLAHDAAVTYEAMDLLLKQMHELGVLWFNVAPAATDVALSAGVATATIGATDYLFPVTMMLAVSNDQFPVEIIGHREYHAIQDKTSQGEPERVYINGTTATFWPVPQANYTAKLTYEAIAADTEHGAAPDIPVAFMRPMATILASDLADEYRRPEQEIVRRASQAQAAWRDIRALNQQRVDTTTVAPEWF